MPELEIFLETLLRQHQAALRWFHDRVGTMQTWPAPLSDGTFLATLAKGIYKPAWSRYALSIRQTLNSTYPDKAPALREDGTWSASARH